MVERLLCSGVSQRRAARILNLNRKTIVRKFRFAGGLAEEDLVASRNEHRPCMVLEFDDLETSEHSKLKPLSITLAVEHPSRRILGYSVAQMPARGTQAKIARAKYGPRRDDRKKARMKLLSQIQPNVHPRALVKSDENPHYVPDVRGTFPLATHSTFKGRKAAIVGQGELKKIGFDPIFSINHTCAMLRANINRLFRRTWCTTKKADQLALHVALYASFHNRELIKQEK